MESWRCSLPLSKDEGDPKKEAVTDFRVLIHEPHTEIDEGLSLIEARPLTGRFHQIRRHLLSAGFPIVGDYRYAGVEQSDRLGELLGTGTRMLLQARKLEFMHPVSEENITIRAPLVEELARCFSSELQSDLL